MKNFSQVMATLRRKNFSQYGLLTGCCFFSVLLISAYVTIMRSPTVLTVLPEGGDSRKQVMMIFVMAVIGCGVFTTYASGLFFRYKSHEMGVFLALGATKRTLRNAMSKELLLIATCSCVLGILLGMPLAWLLWQGFRLLIVDSQEMGFIFDSQALLYAIAFSAFVFIMLFVMLARFLKRTNILDVVNESRKSETVHLVPKYFGWFGIFLIIIGCLLGYLMPVVFIRGLQWYPPEGLTAIFYAPTLVGLYMVLLHTVVNGWRTKKNHYRNIISNSIMQFQGRQTVRNMIVIALLVAGAFFGSFYVPLMATGSAYEYDVRTIDYLFHYRADQNLPDKTRIDSLAEEMNVDITDYTSVPAVILAIDGEQEVESERSVGTTYELVYRKQVRGSTFLSESSYNAITGEHVDVLPGTVASIYSNEGQNEGRTSNDTTLITNVITGEEFACTPQKEVLCNNQLLGIRVLDDSDYDRMSVGLPEDWREEYIAFNVKNVEETYLFAKKLFHEIIRLSGPEVEIFDAWDPVEKINAQKDGEEYWCDIENLAKNGFPELRYDQMDSSEFRLSWKYMPQFRILDRTEFVRTMAVFLMLFIFVAILCFTAVMVILFTRSMTIVMTNRQIYEDLGKLGASQSYLRDTIKNQISRIFVAPITTGTLLIVLFYAMILYFNDGLISKTELLGGRNSLLIVAGMTVLFYGLYRFTLSRVCFGLGLKRNSKIR